MSGMERGTTSRRRRVKREGARSKSALETAAEPVQATACLDHRGGRDRLLHKGGREGPRAEVGDPNNVRRMRRDRGGESVLLQASSAKFGGGAENGL